MRADGLAGPTAPVTGAGSGIGRAVAVAVAAAGARVIPAEPTAATLRQTIELADEATAEWGRASLVYGQPRAPALPAGARAHIVDGTDQASVREWSEAVERDARAAGSVPIGRLAAPAEIAAAECRLVCAAGLCSGSVPAAGLCRLVCAG